MEMSSQFCERESETEYKVDYERTKEVKELQENEAKTANQKLKPQKKLGHLQKVQPIKRHSMETSSAFCVMESETEYKVDHKRTKEVKELQEKEAKTANQKLKLKKKLGRLPRVQPTKRHSMEISSPFCERESEIDYKTKEAKELQKKEAQTANQNLKLPTELGHFSRSFLQKPKLPRLQKIKRHSIAKG